MAINAEQLVTYIVKPALKQINHYSPEAEQLIVGTCAQESHLGEFLHQVGCGPALGIFQMEGDTYHNIWNEFLLHKPELKALLLQSNGYAVQPGEDVMIYNLKYAAQMCRLKYLWITEPLPELNDIEGQAKYWAKYYNGNPVTGKPEKYIASYKQYVGDYYVKR
jgi:hypothetical protein